MARAVGLDAGAHEIKVVELDGSYRKPRLLKVSIDQVPYAAAGEGGAKLEAEAALSALQDQHIRLDNLCLGFPCREAVLRSLKIPFVGDDAIRKVIKFEAEGSIHSHSVDEMVVDFLTLEKGDGNTSVLVAAVPKKSLGALLDALEGEGIEPERVDLDTMALFRVAEWAGCFGEDVAQRAAESAESGTPADIATAKSSVPAVPGRKRAQLVIDVGARSTRVIAVVDGKLIDMRAMRIGTDSIAEEIAASAAVSVDSARTAVKESLDSGEDVTFVLDVEDDAPAVAEDGDKDAPAVPARRADVLTGAAVQIARERFLQKLEREFLRFLTALPQVAGIDRAWVTGGGSLVPGTMEILAKVLECPVDRLDVLARLNHNLSSDDAERIGPRIAVAVGLALDMLSTTGGFDFRRENLAYKRRFDRIKFPLAIATMLAVFLPFIYSLRVRSQVVELEKQYGLVYIDTKTARGEKPKVSFWGYLGALMSKGAQGVQQYLTPKEFATLTDDLQARPTFQRLPRLREELAKKLKDKQAETNIYEDLQVPSGFYVLSRFSDAVKSIEGELGEFLVTEVEVSLPSIKKSKYLQVRVAFRGDDARTRFERLRDGLRATFDRPGSPFVDFKTGQGVAGEEPFADTDVTGAYFTLRIEIADEFQPEVQ
jgi:type IV pilus assembly protein PilM